MELVCWQSADRRQKLLSSAVIGLFLVVSIMYLRYVLSHTPPQEALPALAIFASVWIAVALSMHNVQFLRNVLIVIVSITFCSLVTVGGMMSRKRTDE